jgi:uncharacterized damage-inducible protein DinB
MISSQPFWMELQQESAITRKLLERLPEIALLWKPHEKSMSMVHLAVHLAALTRWFDFIVRQDDYDVSSNNLKMRDPDSVAAILELFDQSLTIAVEALKKQPDERLLDLWRLRNNEQLIFEMPRGLVIRTVLKHLIHHRGQLSVYLRLQGVPLPPIYGPTADEAP